MLRDPLDQYSEWLCNKCDFSLEVSMLAKMFGQRGQNLFFRQYDDLSPCLLFVQMLGQSGQNLFLDNMMIFHRACCLSRCLVRVVKICFSTIWWSFTVFVHKVPDLERKIDQMEEELNDLSAKWDKDDDDEEEEENEEDNKFLSVWFA